MAVVALNMRCMAAARQGAKTTQRCAKRIKEIEISAPFDIAFEATLDHLGPEGEMPAGKPFPMKTEPWSGGRWYRDVGNNFGHPWGHVQVTKPSTLLEICGSLMMSYPALNHLQDRLKPEGGITRLVFLHRAMGLILPEHRDGLPDGWGYWLKRIRELAELRNRKEGRRISRGLRYRMAYLTGRFERRLEPSTSSLGSHSAEARKHHNSCGICGILYRKRAMASRRKP